jgi:RNA polymerase sigma-70 factor (ECF subfamily)
LEETREAQTWTAAELAEYEPALRVAAGALCRQPSDIDDLIQDTFERGLRYLRAGRPRPERMVGWLVTLMRNAFIDRLRRRTPRLEPLEDHALPEEDEPLPAWSELSLAEVRGAIAELDEGFAAAIDLHYFQGLRYREVAERLGIPENTVGSRMHRARKALQAILARRLPQ